jgi:sugar lactone lactonase YvrE
MFRDQSYEVHRVIISNDVCAEGLAWHGSHSALYWTDINRGLLHRHRLAFPGKFETWQFDQPVTAVVVTTDPSKLLVVLGGSILLWNPNDDLREEVLYTLPQWPKVRCNDARVDPAGTLWVGTMQNNVGIDGGSLPIEKSLGVLFSLQYVGVVSTWLRNLGIQNTLAWTPDKKRMLFGDTLRNEIYACNYDEHTQSIRDKTIFSGGFERGSPDGSAMDAEGYLWNCRYGGGCIVRFAPDGSVDHIQDTPVLNPTTCAFGGKDLDILYFTSAAETNGSQDGGLFSFRPKVSGLPTSAFAVGA